MSYGEVRSRRQKEIISGLSNKKVAAHFDADEFAEAVARKLRNPSGNITI